jgi:hypothetical protein
VRRLAALALLLAASAARADLLDCDGDLARGKVTVDLGRLGKSPLRLTACTDAGDAVLGRAYLEWGENLFELDGFGGCGPGALRAFRADDEVLVLQRTCQSREYHPAPAWHAAVLRWDPRRKTFTVHPPTAPPAGK